MTLINVRVVFVSTRIRHAIFSIVGIERKGRNNGLSISVTVKWPGASQRPKRTYMPQPTDDSFLASGMWTDLVLLLANIPRSDKIAILDDSVANIRAIELLVVCEFRTQTIKTHIRINLLPRNEGPYLFRTKRNIARFSLAIKASRFPSLFAWLFVILFRLNLLVRFQFSPIDEAQLSSWLNRKLCCELSTCKP